ncbi:hypothetical protein NL108_008880 [Boleophthalmus pectinirostris]|uniref:ataxin-1-like n=1 Tax=Boleophthalmus pectinirostris TaxID=150288 RepID=UPI000A1C6594|nr:ataxin-1-like [Boleophthalmus pectinirostris]XP_055016515.1 ataxin-1-like [Boleophthalmus pectinirostris]KAJ0068503.1 hypothetical protein NL108_008880 [Boleophthalmus pectinirostris]
MSFSLYPPLLSDRDSLPLKKRDQRPDSPPHSPQCDSAIFKAPYPYKRHSSPFQPVPRRVRPLRHSWTHHSGRIKPHGRSAFTDYQHWTELNNVHSLQSWSPFHFDRLHSHLSGPSKYVQPTPVSLQNAPHWERKLQHTDKEINGRNNGLNMGRRDITSNLSTLENIKQTSWSSSAPKYFYKPTKPPPYPILKVPCSENLTVRSVPPQLPGQAPSCALSPLPWLLPHFEAGSLVELQDGRLQRVESLQTEDFLLGAMACPDLRLSCCTVQRICPSEQTPSVCRLLLLLHQPLSQELVDVHLEYPFFVRGQGWSSCSPQRTARLCGLQCRQLCVGDVCLALTPLSTPCPPDSASQEPETPPDWTDRCEKRLLPPGLQAPPSGESRRPEEGRKRHSSAPN